MDNRRVFCYDLHMMESDVKKRDGFIGERMVVLPSEIFSAYIKHPLVRRMYLTDIGYFPQARHHYRERKEGIEEHVLIFCTKGEGTVCLQDASYTIRACQAICIPAGTAHRYYSSADDPWSLLWVHFKGEDCRYYPIQNHGVLSFASSSVSERMMVLFSQLFSVLEMDYSLDNFIYLSQVLEHILAEVFFRTSNAVPASKADRLLTKTVRFMSEHLDAALSLQEICEQFGASKSRMNTVFQTYTHRSTMAFFIRLKMRQASSLLRSSSYPIYEIARQLGYTDPYYFSRVFKKVMGISPEAYRRGGAPVAENFTPDP